MGRRDKIALGVTLVAVVVLPGVANAILSNLGHDTLGSVVWALGYGSGALFVWYEWIRPLNITGPDQVGERRGAEGGRDGGERSDE